MGCCHCCSSHQAETEVNQIFLDFKGIFLKGIKVILPKTIFTFTVGRPSENVIILPRWICDLFATKVHKEVVFKSAIYTTSVSLAIKGFGNLTQLA